MYHQHTSMMHIVIIIIIILLLFIISSSSPLIIIGVTLRLRTPKYHRLMLVEEGIGRLTMFQRQP